MVMITTLVVTNSTSKSFNYHDQNKVTPTGGGYSLQFPSNTEPDSDKLRTIKIVTNTGDRD